MPERLAYDEAMQFSTIRLKVQDPELKQGKVEMVSTVTTQGTIERPWGIEGGFAVVYKFRRKNGTVCALRCFRVPMNPDTQFRYEHISSYFHTYAPAITAGFKYYDEAIVVKEQGKPPNQKYPVIEMDWIDGVTLVDKIHELCHLRQSTALKDLATQWIAMLHCMAKAHIAHGDLAGVNVMIRVDGRMVLIDYDGVYIPEFASLPQILLGQADFQHPQMAQRHFHEHMDAFSALVIYTALLALTIQPALWDRYAKIGPHGNLLDINILFRQQDFLDPQKSPLFGELEHMGDPYLKTIVQELKRVCQQPINDVRFPFVLVDPHDHEKQALARLESALQTQDDEQIMSSWLPILESYAPAQCHRSRVQLARQRVKALQVFRNALASGNLQSIVHAYNAALLDQTKGISHEERLQLSCAHAFLQAYHDDSDDIFNIAEKLQTTLKGMPAVFSIQQQQSIDLARRRLQALQRFRQALLLVPLNAQSIIDGYDSSLLQTSHAVKDEQREIVTAAYQYMAMYEGLKRGIQADNDDLIRSTYDPKLAQRFSGISSAEQLRIDRAMLLQTLEDLLDKKEYEQALLLAQSIQQKTGREISDMLTFKLKRATMRFIRPQDLSNVRIQVEERADTNYALVSWQWPTTILIHTALIVWQRGNWPERPSEKRWDDPEWKYSWVRRNNESPYSNTTFPIGKGAHIYVRGYAALLDIWDQEKIWRFSSGDEPTSRAEAASPQMTWRMQQ